MTCYVWRDGKFVNKETGVEMHVPAGPVAAPQVVSDTPAYASPITGQIIEGRAARREDLKKHDCIEAGDMPRLNGGMAKSEKYAAKHGLRWQGHQ